jgi:hypothetical protein
MITCVTTFTAYPKPISFEPPPHRIGLHDRVAVPGGRDGIVIGFYCSAADTVLVLFDSGDSREYPPADLHRLG